ncbi:HNH endonuclease signature motif containing protein [Paracoccus sp. (in: a-proteobacteria)]|uniref:HNH endonuclease n=1 Tax=Paracoccus sp. TaxID=267 RepID=UPI0028A2631A|nr:HNH endonuclease signature motif containing protein [Paracoccus sp. (in: a-proteobacteria)]
MARVAEELWTDAELEACVKAYLAMIDAQDRGERFNKSAIYRELQLDHLAGRSEGSIARRMSNLTAFFEERGERVLAGHNGLANIGTNVSRRLTQILDRMAVEDGGEEALRIQAAKIIERGPVTKPRHGVPVRVQRDVSAFARSADVVAWALSQSLGICERCQEQAPFLDRQGLPFLEVHHVEFLRNGGLDDADNVVALCPNCHRAAHHSHDAGDVKIRLLARIQARGY